MSRTQSYASDRSVNGSGNVNGAFNGKGKQKAVAGQEIPVDSSASAASSSSGDFLDAGENGEGYSHEARGYTQYEELIEHNVVWGQTVNVPVSMAISRETNELQSCEMKLVVEQVRVSL